MKGTARQRGLSNIETCVAPAERMPFDDATFDFLGCRFSAHHWRDFEAGLREARRIMKPGGTAVFIDVVSPGHAGFDTHLQTVEALRDPSHVRDYRASEWIAALDRAGFRVRHTQTRRLRMDYPAWVERMRTPEPHRAAIRLLQQVASDETSSYYAIEADGSYTLDTMQIEASACRTKARFFSWEVPQRRQERQDYYSAVWGLKRILEDISRTAHHGISHMAEELVQVSYRELAEREACPTCPPRLKLVKCVPIAGGTWNRTWACTPSPPSPLSRAQMYAVRPPLRRSPS